MSGGVEETLRKANKLLIAHLLDKVINGHGVDQLAVADSGAILEVDDLLLGIDLGDLTLLTKTLLLLGQSLSNGNPNTASAVAGREAESGVGTPVAGGLVQDYVLCDCLDIRSSNTLTKPLALHLKSTPVSTLPEPYLDIESQSLTLVVGTAQTLKL